MFCFGIKKVYICSMKLSKERLVEIFVRFGERLSGFGYDERSEGAIVCACDANKWFTPNDICLAVSAIREQALDKTKLSEWFAEYNNIPTKNPKKVGVIMAGNIPLVGFFDMMYVLLSGNACFVKSSSKDAVLIDFVIELLKDIEPQIPIFDFESAKIDALIAMGGDSANLHFRSVFGDIPSLLRAHRSSVAVLTENADYQSLAQDIFLYNGLGCRNVSLLFIPESFDFDGFIKTLSATDLGISQKYKNNYLQTKAMLSMSGVAYIDGGFFVLCKDDEFPAAISQINYVEYTSLSDVEEWLVKNDSAIQCVVGEVVEHRRRVSFGQAQLPTLNDYPDGKDVMFFLQKMD